MLTKEKCNGKICGQGKLIKKKYVCPHNNLGALYPHLINEWHPDNPGTIFDYTPGMHNSMLWVCPENLCGCHIYDAIIYNKVKDSGCPFCNKKRACIHDNLEVLFPHLKDEWHPDNKP